MPFDLSLVKILKLKFECLYKIFTHKIFNVLVDYSNVLVDYSNMLYYVVHQLRKLMKLLLVVEIVLRHRISLDW